MVCLREASLFFPFLFLLLSQYFWMINSNTARIKMLSTKEISCWEGLLCPSFTASHFNWFFSVVIIEILFLYSRIHLFKIHSSVTNMCSQQCDYHHSEDTDCFCNLSALMCFAASLPTPGPGTRCLLSVTYSLIFSFYWAVFHCVNLPHFVYPVSSWWPLSYFALVWLLCCF